MRSTMKFVVISALMLGAFFTTTPDAEAATTVRSAAMASANTQKGAKYVYGATGGYNKGYDCSGLVYWAYKQHGKTLPRTAADQYKKSTKISSKNRKPGDLIFIADSRGRIFHVGIFTRVKNGKGYMVNANSGRTTAHVVGEWPIQNYVAGSNRGFIGRF
jgi:cell wall-associated NlpC family hydrolase